MSHFTKYRLAWVLLFFSMAKLSAQERLPVFLEMEGGVERFGDASLRSVFPGGMNLTLGPAFSLADQGRLRLRPQAGFKLFFNELDEWTTEHLRFIRLGGQASYDAFYIGQTTFFPFFAIDFNWVANYDAESEATGDSENVSFSDNYLKGWGFSQVAGLRIQYQEFYLKVGYEFFNPRLKATNDVIDGDRVDGYITPSSRRFNFNTINFSLGATVRL
ncbi:hypothetical protein [Parapedobacter koreensis]|uniref:Outer membrane protein beta-barrel domain-containing protein n=1 Tax=Parapedobacter koreensis TaxID=332977 RepID=A0A1H7RD87_9SPHI|nr:hypothetical protein [Parapedobacter koreensis]SEL57884.1 hypothetical protein SAMN05421740_10728 [Parapedobacter koreensis]